MLCDIGEPLGPHLAEIESLLCPRYHSIEPHAFQVHIPRPSYLIASGGFVRYSGHMCLACGEAVWS